MIEISNRVTTFPTESFHLFNNWSLYPIVFLLWTVSWEASLPESPRHKKKSRKKCEWCNNCCFVDLWTSIVSTKSLWLMSAVWRTSLSSRKVCCFALNLFDLYDKRWLFYDNKLLWRSSRIRCKKILFRRTRSRSMSMILCFWNGYWWCILNRNKRIRKFDFI